MSHVDEGTLHAYLDGELPSTERAALEAHLAVCTTCRTMLAEERALLERATTLLGSARPVERPAPPFEQLRRSPWSVRTPVAWAASITLALGLGYYLRTPNARLAPAPPAQPVAMVEAHPANAARQQERSTVRRAAPRETDQLAAEKPRTDSVVGLEPPPPAAAGVVVMQPQVQLRSARPKSVPAPSLGAASAREESPRLYVDGAIVPRDLVATSWPVISRGAAASLLGTDPVGLPGLATRRIRRSPAPDGTVVVEQALDSSTVIRIFQRPADSDGYSLADSSAKAATRQDERRADRLARFVGRLRVEISGPLSPDSLNRLLEQVEPLP